MEIDLDKLKEAPNVKHADPIQPSDSQMISALIVQYLTHCSTSIIVLLF